MDPPDEFAWREMMGLYRQSRIVFNTGSRSIEFYNSLQASGFWNLFYQKFVACPFEDVTSVDSYLQNGYRCLQVKTKHGYSVYMADTVPRFDELVAEFQAICPYPEGS